jgi:multiple sugar transport system permease protein
MMTRSRAGMMTRGRAGSLYVILILLALLFLFPFFWMVASSLKTNQAALVDPAQLIPPVAQWHNYADAWRLINFPRETLNSLVMAGGVTLGQILISALAGYAFARIEFVGRNAIFMIFLATLIVPFQILFVPIYLMLARLGWINTYAALIIPSLGNPFAIFIFRQFFLTVPHELEEAMFMDGAGYLRLFWSLMLPLSGPAVATVFILTFLAEWNSLLKPLVFTTSQSMYTLQVGLSFLNRGAFVTEPRVAWLLAGVTMVIIPPVVVFMLVQRRFVESIASTGLKG